MSSQPLSLPPPVDSPLCCPLCLRPYGGFGRGRRTLYGTTVCRACQFSLINRRRIAWVIDGLLCGAVGCLLMLLILAGGGRGRVPDTPLGLEELALLALPLFACRDAFNGTSLGKLLCGLQVVDVRERRPIGVRASIERTLPFVIPFLGVLIEDFAMNRGPRLGDWLARTMVIRKAVAHRAPYAFAGRYCTHCAYDLTGNVTGVCPECGTAVRAARPVAEAMEATRA